MAAFKVSFVLSRIRLPLMNKIGVESTPILSPSARSLFTLPAQDQIRCLPDVLLARDSEARYRVEFSEQISREKEHLERRITDNQELQ